MTGTAAVVGGGVAKKPNPGTCSRITQLDEHAVRLQAKNILKYPCSDSCGPPAHPVIVNGENLGFYRLQDFNENANEDGGDWRTRASRDMERNTSNLPPLPYLGRDEHNPPMQSLQDYVRMAEKVPLTPVVDVDIIDPEFLDADHMTRVYHNMLSDIHNEVEKAIKPCPKAPKKCCLRKKEPPRLPRWPETDVAESFRMFAGCTNIENSPLEEALTEMGQAYDVMAAMKDDLAKHTTSHYLEPLKAFLDVDFKDLDLKSKQVHEAAHKIEKMKATGVSKPEMAELKRTFAESRAKTINLFQFVLNSDYSQISKMTDLAECWLGYFREGYRLFDSIIHSFEAKAVKLKPKRHKRLCIIPPKPPLAENQILAPPPSVSAGNTKHAATQSEVGKPGATSKMSGKRDKRTEASRAKTYEKATNALVTSTPVRTRHDKQTNINARLFVNASAAMPRRHQCACPKDQLMFLPAMMPPRYFGGGGGGEGAARGEEGNETPQPVEKEATSHELEDSEESDDEFDDEETTQFTHPQNQCQCPEPALEPGFPRWWKKVEPAAPKPVKRKEEPLKEEPPKERIQLKCRGANHVLNGPCVCESETRLREQENDAGGKNKDFFVYRGARELQTPYAFVRADPGDGFPGHVGDAVHLLFKDEIKGQYECSLADGTERHTTIPFEYLDVIVDVDNIVRGIE